MDSKSFTHLVMPFRPNLHRYALSLCGDEDLAQDLMQETYMCAWQNRDNLHKYQSKIEALLIRILHNTFIDHKRRPHIDIDPDNNGMQLTADDNASATDTKAYVQTIIRRLPPLQRQIITMKEIDGYENHEIASILGTNEAAVRKNLQRARERIRQLITQNF